MNVVKRTDMSGRSQSRIEDRERVRANQMERGNEGEHGVVHENERYNHGRDGLMHIHKFAVSA